MPTPSTPTNAYLHAALPCYPAALQQCFNSRDPWELFLTLPITLQAECKSVRLKYTTGKLCTEKELNNRGRSSTGLPVVSNNKREEPIRDENHIIYDKAKD